MKRRARWLMACAAAACAGGALAQEADAPAVRVAVYDFIEPNDYQGHLVGRRAAEAVQFALAERGAWELVERGALLRECAAEGVSAPFGVGYLQMFGRRLNASLAVPGLVQACAVNPQRGTAQVTLVCELIEAIGGEGLGSFRGVGSARREPEETVALDVVLDRALTEAAANAVDAMMAFDAWTTTVMARLGDDQALLQPLGEDRIKPGDKAIVCRREPRAWVLVAVVEVLRSDNTTVRTRIVSELSTPQANDVAVCVGR